MAKIQKRAIHPLSSEQAKAYWSNLRENGLILEYQEHLLQYGHPFLLEKSLAHEIVSAATAISELVKDEIAKAGGLTPWLENHPLTFGAAILNNPLINKQLEERLNMGFQMPIAYDGILVSERGKPGFKVIEVQSAIGYGPWIEAILKSAGYNPESETTYYGQENPLTVLKRFKEELTGGEEVTVMDLDPFGATQVDQIGIARAMGNPNSLPISSLDVCYDSRAGYYYYRYAVDPTTGKPKRDAETGQFLKTGEKVRITHVLSRMLQSDLDRLDMMLQGDPAHRNLLLKFLDDPSIHWVWHPGWQYIIDKSTLPLLRKILEQRGSRFSEQFVPVYGPGEIVAKGTYVRKPANAESGKGQAVITVNDGEVLTAEEGMIYQGFIKPYPMRVILPTQLAEKFYPERRRRLCQRFGLEPTIAWSNVEIRFTSPPYCRNELKGRFLARLAPRYRQRDSVEYAQTNVGKIQEALYNIIDPKDHELYPFGFCPVIIQ
jgi:hypothetical protein